MSTNLPISNIVNVSVATPPTGLSDYQVNNLAIFTKETPIVSIPNFGVYLSPSQVATDWGSGSEVYAMAVAIFSQSPNILDGGGQLIIFPMQLTDTLAVNIPLAIAQIFFGGALYAGYAPNNAEVLAAATVCQAQKTLLFVSTYLTSDLTSGGLVFQIQAAKETYARCILYTVSATAARLTAAAYAGRAMSVDFSGSNTTATMHMKDLATITPDPGITQSILNSCLTAGADVYTYFGGLGKVFSTGGNDFWDNVYNLNWLVFALQVAGFNALATTPTKIPQTEPGMAVLRGAYIGVLQEAVVNGFVGPGAWNSPELFGNPADLKRNVLDFGFYVYSQPVNQQSQANRAARKAPLIQMAIKYQGAIHSTSVIVNINA